MEIVWILKTTERGFDPEYDVFETRKAALLFLDGKRRRAAKRPVAAQLWPASWQTVLDNLLGPDPAPESLETAPGLEKPAANDNKPKA